jgi:hypothetical protein
MVKADYVNKTPQLTVWFTSEVKAIREVRLSGSRIQNLAHKPVK